jgi:UDP-4-amino-4,6-dideoxy-N-acetyl-beta-L-altrosamine transaminase
MKSKIPYASQNIIQEDIDAVVRVLKSKNITQGPVIERFEKSTACYCGAKYAVAASSGTGALHIACLAAGLREGQTLWTSVNTFAASANCALYCGAGVDLVDIDSRTYNISAQKLEAKLKKIQNGNYCPKIVIPVHFAGQSCDMSSIRGLSTRFGFKIIEDATHALGASYKGARIGSCEYSDMAVFSFHPAKMITTGEGGMVLTNSEDLYRKLIRLRTHGITRDPKVMKRSREGPWYYEQLELGFNYRMTDIQAALGLSQLSRLDRFVDRRRRLAGRYDALLKDLPLTLPFRDSDSVSSWHLYVVRINSASVKKTHKRIFEELRSSGIEVNLHYIPVPLHPFYKSLGFKMNDFTEAAKYYGEAISLPIFVGLSREQQNRVAETLRRILKA